MSSQFEEYYREENQRIIESIKATHNWEVDEGFIADGLISPQKFEDAKIKIAVFLGESYGYYKGYVDIQKQLEQDYLGVGHPKRMTAKKIPMLVWLLLNHFERGERISKEEFKGRRFLKTNRENTSELQLALAKIAWINVKKASKVRDSSDESPRQIDSEILDHTKRNAPILERQIRAINPELLIVCSDPVFNGMLSNGLLGNGVSRGMKYSIQENDLGKKVVHLSHPSYYKIWSYNGIYKIYEQIIEKMA